MLALMMPVRPAVTGTVTEMGRPARHFKHEDGSTCAGYVRKLYMRVDGRHVQVGIGCDACGVSRIYPNASAMLDRKRRTDSLESSA